MDLDVLIEGLLFYNASPQKKQKILKLFDVDQNTLQAALDRLRSRLVSGATRLLETDTELQLVTAPELSEFVQSIQKGELSQDISKAGAETLAIVLYREPITRGEIDQIRGVNSAFILRNLMTRGLIERKSIKNSHEFCITPQLLQFLGVTSKQDLPQYDEFMTKIDNFAATKST